MNRGWFVLQGYFEYIIEAARRLLLWEKECTHAVLLI